MWMKILETVLRTIIAYIILLIVGRLIGRKMLSGINFFDFIVGVSLGSLAVRIALGTVDSLLLCIIAALIFATLALITEKCYLMSPKAHSAVEGEPIVLVSRGLIIDGNMKKARVSVKKLLMMLREKDIFNVGDVELAVIETDGQLTAVPAGPKRPAAKGDVGAGAPDIKMPSDFIIDGEIIEKNIDKIGYDRNFLMEQLAAKKLMVKDVFYAGLDSEGTLYITPKGIAD